MRSVTLCVLLLINTNATATGLRGFIKNKRPIDLLREFGGNKLAGLSSKAKQLGAGLLLAGIVTCSTMSCVTGEITNLTDDKDSANLDQVTFYLIVDTRYIEIVDQNLPTIVIDKGTVATPFFGTLMRLNPVLTHYDSYPKK